MTRWTVRIVSYDTPDADFDVVATDPVMAEILALREFRRKFPRADRKIRNGVKLLHAGPDGASEVGQ